MTITYYKQLISGNVTPQRTGLSDSEVNVRSYKVVACDFNVYSCCFFLLGFTASMSGSTFFLLFPSIRLIS